MGVIMITPVNSQPESRALNARGVPAAPFSPGQRLLASRTRQRGGVLGRLLAGLFVLALVSGLGVVFGFLWWTDRPLTLASPTLELSVEQGATPRAVAQDWVDAGVQTSPRLLFEWFRWSGQARQIKAGSYEITTGITPSKLLAMMVRGDESLAAVKLIDGWTFKRWRQEMARAEGLEMTTQGMSEFDIMAALGSPDLPAEGQFYPDTYAYAKGNTDLAVMRRAHRAMQKQLEEAWTQRSPASPLKTPQELLILASIVEKETGHESDRGLVAGVFINRLRVGMPLQTDPTVIYGLGDAFDGNLRKVHLLTDTPYNTYTRRGLPPSPIAMPGKAALLAAARPDATRALYFVAQGDGRSAFSETLTDHNRAVNRYQRNRP